MEALEQKILSEGTVLKGDILKVGSFLNQQLDVNFLLEMGKEINRLYEGSEITKILTIEASGIAVAVAAGVVMGKNVVFAKKNKTLNVSGKVLSAMVHSYTHNTDYLITVPEDYIKSGDKILIIDDFLANGKALCGLIELVTAAGAEVVGAGIVIEKAYQPGGALVRSKGVRVESLARVAEMKDDGSITFCD